MSDSLKNRVYVGKLHYDVRDSDLKRFFKDYGKITDINLKNGYAFVVSNFLHYIKNIALNIRIILIRVDSSSQVYVSKTH